MKSHGARGKANREVKAGKQRGPMGVNWRKERGAKL